VAGEVASRVAVDAIEAFAGETAGADRNRTWPFPYDPTVGVDANRLMAAFRLANRRIAAAMEGSQDLRGMATTASAVLLGSRDAKDAPAAIAHVGDSRVYLLRTNALQQLTHDHSWVEEQVRAGTMTATAARQHPWRNVVTRALAGGDDPEVDVVEVTLTPADRILLCSDGLFAVLPNERIEEIMRQEAALETICGRLIESANQGGGPDNITTLLLQVDAA
jgi:protein phosphatase